jgi:predicted PurR-regulated permease PerM
MAGGDAVLVRRLLIVVGVAVAAGLLWMLREVALLAFASVVFALLLRSVAGPLGHALRLAPGLALALTVIALVLALSLLGAFFGWRMAAQISEANALLPEAFTLFLAWVRSVPLGSRLMGDMNQIHFAAALPTLMHVPGYALSAVAILADGLLTGIGGVYLAAQPRLYREGLVTLLPPALRPRLDGVMEESGRLLRRWLLAQLIAMISVGFMVGIGLTAIGVPAPGALGLFAGLAEFVPFAGPVVSAVPALLLALLHGPDKAGWTLVLFVAIQQIEGNLLLPLLQRRIVLMPPALTLFALVVFGVIFGPLGVFLATPLTILVIVLVKQLYLPFVGGVAGAGTLDPAQTSNGRAKELS